MGVRLRAETVRVWGVGACTAVAVLASACSIFDDDATSGDTAPASTDTPAPSGTDNVPTGNPNGKEEGGECTVGGDCKSGVCTGSKCATPTHTDGVKNGDETGLDCGGSAPKCKTGQGCSKGADCVSNTCLANKCADPTATDGQKNGTETDVDCGGKGAPPCADHKACGVGGDCTSGVCGTDKTCKPPAPNDSVQNGDETDVDCGGSTTGAPRCAATKGCKVHADCASDGCDDTKHCALQRSCTAADGGRTCGTGEVDEATKQHESCCIALPVPNSTVKLDKYKVTAGRMRAFIERVNGDVKTWYMSNKASLSTAAQGQIDPYVGYLPTSLHDDTNGADYQLGGTIYLTDRPSTQQGCFTGNAGNAAVGAHTYWNGTLEQEDRPFDQAFLDRLPLNCVPYPLMAAFCAWDGGRLQSFGEHAAAYGTAKYPWGATPDDGGYQNVGGNWTLVGPATGNQGPCPSCDPTYANWLNNYQYPEGGDPTKYWDFAYFISAPGRFPHDSGPNGHKDIGGLMMELTADVQGSDPDHNQPKVRWSNNGSWEGHAIGYSGYSFAVMTKYGKTGGRCAYDP